MIHISGFDDDNRMAYIYIYIYIHDHNHEMFCGEGLYANYLVILLCNHRLNGIEYVYSFLFKKTQQFEW